MTDHDEEQYFLSEGDSEYEEVPEFDLPPSDTEDEEVNDGSDSSGAFVYKYKPNGALVITNEAIVYPWYPLHNDAPALVRIAGIDWPTASHFIYASILGTGLDRVALRNISNVHKMKDNARKFYDTHLNDIQRNALEKAYIVAFRNPVFLKQVSALRWKAKELVYDSPNTLMGRRGNIGENLVGKLLSRVQVTGVRALQRKVVVIEEDSAVGPYAIHPDGLNIDGFIFETIAQYIYFCYYLFFVRNDSVAYMYTTSSHNLEETFLTLQSSYFETKIWNATREALTSKFLNMSRVLLSAAPPNVEMVDTHPFLGPYISFASTIKLQNLKSSQSFPFAVTVRRTACTRFEEDAWTQSWVVQRRLPLMLETIELFANYLKVPMLGHDADSLVWILDLAFPACVTDDTGSITCQPPLAFQKAIPQKRYEPRSVYVMWERLSRLFMHIPPSTNIPGPDEFMSREIYANIPNQFPVITIVDAFMHLLYIIRSVKIKFAPSKISLPSKREFILAQHLLHVSPVIAVPRLSKNALRNQVSNTIASIYGTKSAKESASEILSIAETLHDRDLPLTTRAAIHFYSN